jgi:pimeloyl-ACP methyl ester carboxylesterase
MATRQTVSVRDGLFEATVFTEGDGAPLLFLHGGGGLPEWPAWLSPLAERYRVIAPQHPGFGASTGLEHLDTVQDLTIYYLDFLDALDVERACVVGLSFGGMLAAELAALAPQRVRKLVLVGAIGLWSDAAPMPDFFAMTADEIEQAAWRDVELARRRGWLVEPQTDEEKRAAMLERARSSAATAKFIWPIPDRGLRKRIHRVAMPTLIVWGASDRLVPPVYAELFHQAIAGSRVVMIEEAGHAPQVEQPGAFTAAVLDFLADEDDA